MIDRVGEMSKELAGVILVNFTLSVVTRILKANLLVLYDREG